MKSISEIVADLDALIKTINSSSVKVDNGVIHFDISLPTGSSSEPNHLSRAVVATLLVQLMDLFMRSATNRIIDSAVEVDYREPILYGQDIHIQSKVVERDSGKVYLRSEIRFDSGVVAAIGRGIYTLIGEGL